MKKLKVKYRKKRYSPQIRLEIIRDYNTGIIVTQIMKKYGIALSTVYRILDEYDPREGREHVKEETGGSHSITGEIKGVTIS